MSSVKEAKVYVIQYEGGTYYGGQTLDKAKVFHKPGPPKAIVTKRKKRFKDSQKMVVHSCTLTLGEPVS